MKFVFVLQGFKGEPGEDGPVGPLVRVTANPFYFLVMGSSESREELFKSDKTIQLMSSGLACRRICFRKFVL